MVYPSLKLRCLSLSTLPNLKEGYRQTITNKMEILSREEKKPKFLCLHGNRTSAEIMKKQIGKWDQTVLDKMDLVFVDATFPATGPSSVQGIFDPPYFEWFQSSEDYMEQKNFDECIAYIEECMLKHGPFDGLMGFSQGAILSAALPGLQNKGLALKKVPKIKFVIIIGGAKFPNEKLSDQAYWPLIEIPSLHFIGEHDFLKPHGTKLVESFVHPVVIHHPRGHTVPRLDEKSLEIMHKFLERIKKALAMENEPTSVEEDK